MVGESNPRDAPRRMEASVVLAHVRQRVAEAFRAQGESLSAPPAETLLIRGGHYCGRRFTAPSGRTAIWFIEEDELKLYDVQGELALAARASRCDEPLRRAA